MPEWRRSRLDGVGRQALLGLLGPAVARSQTALSPFGRLEPQKPLAALGHARRSTGNPYCGEARPGELLLRPSTVGRLDLSALEWIPLTYSLPDPGWPRLPGKNDAGIATELGGIPILPSTLIT